MQLSQSSISVSRTRRLLGSQEIRFAVQLAAGLSPPLAWIAIRGLPLDKPLIQNTLLAIAMAVVGSWYAMSRLRSYAKARQLSYVFLISFLMFSSALGVIAVFRLEYSAVLFGTGTFASVAASYLSIMLARGSRKVQFVVPGGRTDQVELSGHFVPAPDVVELKSLVEARRIDGAIVADLHYDHPEEWERLFAKAALQGIAVYHYRQVAEMQSGQVRISHLSENDLGSLIPNAPYIPFKRLIDISLAVLLLPVCLVAFAVIAAAIKLDSPGSVFFIQDRVGFRGAKFRMIKFRTMRPLVPTGHPVEDRELAMTQTDDARVTRIGRFLRKTRIDELPQILNVLSGEMSFIGPRPEAIALSKWYEAELPFYSYRHIVRPGITGWAQVNQGHVTEVSDVSGKLRYDFYYIKNISLWLDLLVALKTLRVILTGFGSR